MLHTRAELACRALAKTLLNSAILPAHGAQAVAVLQHGIDARAAAEAVLTARGRGRRGCHFLHAHRALVTLRVFRVLRAHVRRQVARLAERSGAVGARVVLALLVHRADRKSTRLNSSHTAQSRMPSSA